MSKGSLITLAVLVVLIVGGVLGFKTYKKSELGKEAQASAHSLVRHSVVVQQNKDYVFALMDRFHPEAFAKAYSSGGLTGGAEYDEEVYLDALWTRVKDQARQDGREELLIALPSSGSGVH